MLRRLVTAVPAAVRRPAGCPNAAAGLPRRLLSASEAVVEDAGPVAPPPATADELKAFVRERKEWRAKVGIARKQYFKEQEEKRAAEEARRKAEREQVQREKAERMRLKLERSAEKRKLLDIEREADRARLEEYRAFTAALRAKRDANLEARYKVYVDTLKKESELWLTPDTYEAEIDEAFMRTPGMAGHFPEYSPYWGYVADVPQLYDTDGEFNVALDPTSLQSQVRVATKRLRQVASTYTEYKAMREHPGYTESMEYKFGEARADSEHGDNTFASDELGADEPEGSVAAEDEDGAERLKLDEQLARLRARRHGQVPPRKPAGK